jgi:hypothetical protein
MTVIYTRIQEIRDIICASTIQNQLMKNGPQWIELTTCLDTIQDTDHIIEAYVQKSFNNRSDTSFLYLLTYGLLQALYTQQDGVTNLYKIIGIDLVKNDYPQLKRIRDIRNDCIGHPSRRNPNGTSGPTYHRIVMVELSYEGFEYQSDYPKGRLVSTRVCFSDLIADQVTGVSSILVEVINKLRGLDKHVPTA